MSIKDELKEKFKNRVKTQEELKLEAEAINMLEEFIIPKFRDIANARPYLYCLEIAFHDNISGFFYTSDIDEYRSKKASPYKRDVVEMAVDIDYKYDIEACKVFNKLGGISYRFILDLR